MDSSEIRLSTLDGSTLFSANALKETCVDIYIESRFARTEKFMLFMMNHFSDPGDFRCIENSEEQGTFEYPAVPPESYIATLLRFLKYLSKANNYCYVSDIITLCSASVLKLIENLFPDIEKDLITTSFLCSLSIDNVFDFERSTHDIATTNIEEKQLKSLHINLCIKWRTKPENVGVA
jgi:Cft2 family RNA processing exonuclease